jgi:predicted MPP superfamily phosphohydrolase
MTQADTFYNVLMLSLVAGETVLLWRLKTRRPAPMVASLGMLLAGITFFGAFFNSVEGFGKIRLLAWAVFVHYPLFLIGAACVSFHRRRTLSYICAALAVCIGLVGLDAFLVEPHWIEVTRITIPSSKLQRPVRVVVMADIQTDRLQEYEQHVLELVADEQPDLILFAGDYLHISDPARYAEQKTQFNALMLRSDLKAPLGSYAVKGNVDWSDWPELFTGSTVVTLEATSSLDLGPVVLTGLTLQDSANAALSVSAHDKFHIVLGHVPNYSLGQIEADLLIAGHTHGGQVRIPFVGPIFTLSQVPRSWASGMTPIASGRHLIVSRGIGMERMNAPRMRFLCRPELVVLDLVPAEESETHTF